MSHQPHPPHILLKLPWIVALLCVFAVARGELTIVSGMAMVVLVTMGGLAFHLDREAL